MSDDNALKDVDLSAWDVPAPETGADELADSVIARVGGTDVGAAIPVEAGPLSGKKRALLIAGVAAAVIAVVAGGWAIVRGTQHVAPATGEVVAKQAQSLDLDAARADLDSGADVKWTRKGHVLRVEQRAGSVAWRVGTDEKLVVDVGPGQGTSTGAALASVEATGASLRVEVTPMNAADVKIAGAIASTAAAVALVTVVVYEGHVKVRDGTTQQTVIVQPGTTYTVKPGPMPIPVANEDDVFIENEPVVGVAPVGADQRPEVRIVAGDDVVIHDMQPPSKVRIDTRKVCRNNDMQLVVNGVTLDVNTLAFNRGTMTYKVVCDNVESANGTVTVVRDPLSRGLPPTPPVNPINADGRLYRIAFQTMPALEVHGGPGTLHLSHGGVEKTYVARGESVLVPSADLEAGDYSYWFTPDVMSQLSLSLDTNAPILTLDPIAWGPQLQLAGITLAGATLTVEGVAIPVDGSGRFKAIVAGGTDTLVLRLEHPSAGLHYAIARSGTSSTTSPNPVTVSQSTTLNRAAIATVMGSLKSKLASCVQSNPPKARATVKVKVSVQPDGRVKGVDVAQGVSATLDQCFADVITATAFPAASQSTVFLFPIVVEPPAPSTTSTTPVCDADELKDKGMENVNMGQHDAALASFEASLRCKSDTYVIQLAFMSACNAHNDGKARLYYSKLSPTQQSRYLQLCVRNHIDPTGPVSSTTSGTNAVLQTNCDADALKDKGMENVNMGQHAAALANFEASLRCKNDSYVLSLAFMAACNSQNAAKARGYWNQLPNSQRQKYKVMCTRNHIDPTAPGPTATTTATDSDTDLSPPTCDADALKDKGMENLDLGQHANALRFFEQSIACKPDAYVRSLAFLAACNSADAAKAKKYWSTLTATQQSKFKQICIRNNIDPDDWGVTDPAFDAKGYLQLAARPAAKVLIDGVDTGLVTPVPAKKLPLTPGKHKVTLVVGDERFTYPVTIQAGKTVEMSKDLR